jgi:P27 family predicted phage terminase small subunit
MAGNANSGRRPQPTALKVLRGNPSKTRLNKHEPKPPVPDATFDEPPPELAGDGVAEAEWRRIAPIVRLTRILSDADRPLLIALCQQWSRYLEAHGKVASLGMVVKAGNGQPVVNPYLAVSDKALVHCQKMWNELGLTPSSRSRVAALPQVERASKWTGLL